MKRIFSLMLALLLLCSMVACADDGTGDNMNNAVINIGGERMVYTAENGDAFTYEYLSSTTVIITAFDGKDAPHTVTVPGTITVKINDEETKDYLVAEIGEGAFKDYSNIAEVVLPANLLRVGPYAFANCVALTKVTLPDTLTSIGTGAFYSCAALAECALPANLTTIENHAFYGCAALNIAAFPASLRSIGELAFGHCTSLSAIELLEGIESVGSQAFYNCTAVAKLSLPASLTEIGRFPFNPAARDLPEEAITVVEGSAAAQHIYDIRNNTSAQD